VKLLLALVFALPAQAYDFRQDFTRELEGVCDYLDEPKAEADEARARLCACLGGKCEGLDGWEKELEGFLSFEPLQGEAPSCLAGIRERRRYLFHEFLFDRCEKNPEEAKRLARFTVRVDADTCWNIVDLTDEGCLVAKACSSAGALVSALGVASTERRLEATVCEKRLTRTHARRDPELRTSGYHKPVTQAHLDRYYYPHGEGTYATANCHGTAEMLAGEFLSDTPVTSYSTVPAYQATCGEGTKALYDKARGSKLHPTIGELGLRRGIAINMVYEACTADDCGAAELTTYGCSTGEWESFVFIKDMCLACWEKRLKRAGFRALGTNESWESLHPGCTLNQSDHSVTLVAVSHGMCTTYEAPNPGGPPQLKTTPCPSLYASFPRRWCPAKPTAFTLK
jgi:hypothetical protein